MIFVSRTIGSSEVERTNSHIGNPNRPWMYTCWKSLTPEIAAKRSPLVTHIPVYFQKLIACHKISWCLGLSKQPETLPQNHNWTDAHNRPPKNCVPGKYVEKNLSWLATILPAQSQLLLGRINPTSPESAKYICSARSLLWMAQETRKIILNRLIMHTFYYI